MAAESGVFYGEFIKNLTILDNKIFGNVGELRNACFYLINSDNVKFNNNTLENNIS